MESGAVGHGPDHFQAGMVLRRTSRAGYLQVVGEGYIPGVMNGEVSQGLRGST